MPIFRVKSVKIYTGQKKFTRIYPWDPWQIWGMYRSTTLERIGRTLKLKISLIQEHYIGKLELPDLGASEYIRSVHRISIYPSLRFIHNTSTQVLSWISRSKSQNDISGLSMRELVRLVLASYCPWSSTQRCPPIGSSHQVWKSSFLVWNLVLRIERPIPRKLGKWAHV